MKSLLPIIFVILVLTGAITFSLAKRSIPEREENRFGIPANQLESNTADNSNQNEDRKTFLDYIQPSPTPTAIITPKTNEITPLPTITEGDSETEKTKGGEVVTKKVASTETKITRTTVCTPVYGAANTCTEHVVVDTGAEDAIFFNFAGLSYLAGLAAFIKAKTLKA